MARGENIYKRKDGRWEARYAKGYDLSGKIQYGFCYGKTYKEAKEKVTLARAALLTGGRTMGKKRNPQFSYYCDEWLKNSRMRVKETTYAKYMNVLERHILPKLGDCSTNDLTTGTIETFSEELFYEQELSPKTVKDILVILKSILTYASHQHPGVFMPVEITYPKDIHKEMRVLSTEEQACLTQYLLTDMDECQFGILLALFTGIRIGELCALQWNAISLEEKTIRIASTMQRIKNIDGENGVKTKIVVGSAKSYTSVRVIPLTEKTVELCERFRPDNPSAYVLTGSTDYMEPRTLQYRLDRYTRDCGLEGVHFHTLRHTFATRCVEVGFEIKSLSEILGHATTTITLDRYVHSSMALKRDNMKKLSSAGI